jgi:WD40 repeat protein
MNDKCARRAAEPRFAQPGTAAKVTRMFGNLCFHTDGDVLALAFTSPEILRSVEEPGVLRQWHIGSRQALGSAFLSDLETSWCFSGAGQALVSASDEVALWDPAAGALVKRLPQPSWVTALVMRAQPAQVATGHDDGVVRIWDPADESLVHELAGHDQPIGALAYSQDGARLASAGEDRIIRIWDVDGGRLLGTLSKHTDRIGAITWHPEGRILVSAAWDRTARLWDTATFEPIILLNAHADQVTALALSPDGSLLACADSANTIHIWDPVTTKEMHVLHEHQNEIRCLAFSSDSQQLASGGADRMIRLWDPRAGRLILGRGQSAPQRTHLAVVHEGKHLASTCGGAQLRVWNVASGRPGGQPAGAPQPEVLAGSPDGRWLAGGHDKHILLWDAATGQMHTTLEGQAGNVAALAFAPDSTILASASASDGTVWLWNVETREPVLVVPMAADACTVETLAFHPQEQFLAAGGIDWLATGGSDGAVSVWDVAQRQLVGTFRRGATAIAFHPAGRWLAAASLQKSLCVWDMQTGQLALELTGHTDTVTCVAYSPDGAWLVSGSEDRTLRFWNVGSRELVTIQTLDTPIKAMTFSADGRYLFTGNGNTTCYAISLDSCLGNLRRVRGSILAELDLEN